MSDLPPSPTTSTIPNRFFPTPSPLSLPITGAGTGIGTVLASTTKPGQQQSVPLLRPLDLSMSLTGDKVFDELEKTVDEMKVWLEIVENGLEDLMRFDIEVAS